MGDFDDNTGRFYRRTTQIGGTKMNIKVLGMGCANCSPLTKKAKAVVHYHYRTGEEGVSYVGKNPTAD